MGDENFNTSEDEEIEYYDMSAFERRLMKRVNFMDNKLDRILDMTGDSNARIRGIQFQYTRRTLSTLIKWGIIIGGIAYIYFSFIQPIMNPDSTSGQILQGLSNEEQGESDSFFNFSRIGDYLSGLGDSAISTEKDSE